MAIGAVVVLGVRKRAFQPFTTLELATAAVLICLLHVAVVPWQIGLAKVPGLDALVFSIPYTAIFLLGLRLVPKPGFATLLIFGQGLFGQLLGRGINPAWWPYYLWCALGVEILLLSAGGRVKKLPVMLGAGVLRGLLAYAYMYLILAPFLWHQFYAPWYVVCEDPDGPDRLRPWCRACLAARPRDRESRSLFKPVSGMGGFQCGSVSSG